jgi:hypothetical protein
MIAIEVVSNIAAIWYLSNLLSTAVLSLTSKGHHPFPRDGGLCRKLSALPITRCCEAE